MYKAVIIDDDSMVRKGLKSLIDWSAYDFELCGVGADGKEGLEIIRNEKPDLIVTDIMMPDMNGFEMLLESQCPGYSPKIIIITGHRNFDYARNALVLGAMDILLKPTGIEAFHKAVKNASQSIRASKEETDLYQRAQSIIDRKDKQILVNDLADVILRAGQSGDLAPEAENLIHDDREFRLLCVELPKTSPDLPNKVDLVSVLNEFLDHGSSSLELASDSMGTWYVLQPPSGVQRFIDLPGQLDEVFCVVKKNLSNELPWTLGPSIPDWRDASEIVIGMKASIMAERGISTGFSKFKDIDADPPTEILSRVSDSSGPELDEAISLLVSVYSSRCAGSEDMETIRSHYWQGFRDVMGFVHQRNKFHTLDAVDSGILFHQRINQVYSRDEIETVFRNYVENVARRVSSMKYSHLDRIVSSAEEFIMTHFDNPFLSLGEISEFCRVSTGHFSRVFKQRKGICFSQYLNELRIDKAKQLIDQKDMYLYEVGDRVGLPDPQYFSRVFKRICGVSPSEYRNSCLQKAALS